jgi:tetratricopeptide (TPR) repeat protein
MPRLQSLVHLLAIVLCLSFTIGAKADDVQDINQLFRKGELNTALTRANEFLSKNPKDAHVRFLKGLILADLGKTSEAIQTFTALTEDYPELPEPYNNLAVLFASQGNYEAAKNALEMAIRTHPSYATAHENLGDLYAKMASQAYDKALQIDSSNKTAQTKLALIKEMITNKPQRPGAAPAGSKPAPAVAQAPAPAPAVAQAPAPALAKAAAAADAKPPAPSAGKAPDLVETVQSWAKAWSNKDVDAYLAHYSPDFSPANMGYAEWAAQRRERIAGAKRISVVARDIRVKRISPDRAEVSFTQVYKSDRLGNSSSKTLHMELTGGKWLIVRESGR